MSENVGAIYYTVESDTAKLLNSSTTVDASLDKLTKTMGTTDRGAAKLDTKMTTLASSVQRMGRDTAGATSALGGFGKVLGGLLTLQGVKSLIDLAEGYGEMSERVRMATASATEYEMVQQRLLVTANSTYRALSEASEVYIRTADSLRSMGYSTEGAMDVVDSLSYLFVTNATSAQRADGAISAFTKSLNKGKVEADGWESLLAAVPSIINDIAASSGKSAEEIRRMGVSGELTSRMLTQGLASSLDKNREAAAQMATNLKDAFRAFSNSLSVFLGEANNASGATGVLSSAIIALGDNIGTIVKILTVAGAGVMARYISQMGLAAVASAKSALAARLQANEELRLAQAHAATTAAALASANANMGLGGSHAAAATAARAHQAALAGVAVAQRTAAAAGSTLMGVLGGPVGIIALVASAAAGFVLFGNNASKAAGKIDGLADSIDKLGKAQLDLRRQQAGEAMVALEKNARDAGTAVQALERDYTELQKQAQAGRGVDAAGLQNVQKTLVEQRAAQEAANEELARGRDIQKQITDELERRAKAPAAGGSGPAAQADPEVAKRLAGMRDELELAKLTGAARARLQAIQKLGANATGEEREEAEKLAVQIFNLEAAQKGAGKATKDAATAQKENATTLNELALSLKHASLEGEALAAAKARASLNSFATPKQIQEAEALAIAAWKVNEQMRIKESFGKDPVKTITGEVTPLSGGAFDDQFARYAAEAETEKQRYAEQQKRLKSALEVQKVTREQYASMEESFARTHADRMAQIEDAKSMTLLQSGENSFSALADVMRQSQGEQSGIYRAMFAVSKAFAIAKAGIAVKTAVAEAAASGPFPWNMTAMASVAAATAGLVGEIAGVSLGGGRQYGGAVSPNKMHRINENGKPEVLKTASGQQYLLPNTRGEVVSNRDATSSAPGNSGSVNMAALRPIHIETHISSDGSISSSTGGDGADALAREVNALVTAAVQKALDRSQRQGGTAWAARNRR